MERLKVKVYLYIRLYIYSHMHLLAALIKCAMHGKRDVGFKMIIYIYICITNVDVKLYIYIYMENGKVKIVRESRGRRRKEVSRMNWFGVG